VELAHGGGEVQTLLARTFPDFEAIMKRYREIRKPQDGRHNQLTQYSGMMPAFSPERYFYRSLDWMHTNTSGQSIVIDTAGHGRLGRPPVNGDRRSILRQSRATIAGVRLLNLPPTCPQTKDDSVADVGGGPSRRSLTVWLGSLGR